MNMLKQKQSGNYLSVIGGTIRRAVPENTNGAVKREYETSDGKKGVKFELVYTSLIGKIKSVSFFEGDFGKQISLRVQDDSDEYTLSIGVEQPFAEDLMKKLPAVDLTKEVEIAPYDFEDENGKRRRGITLKQNGEAIKNFFYDGEKTVNGIPAPEGDVDMYDKEDWKVHFIKVRKFLISYTEKNVSSKLDDFDLKPKSESKSESKSDYPESSGEPEF